ncbi:hypothetical protein GE09DRAFT_1292948 [Coniochaeta sp. 2T2.1]|nr:hypothetical protein GE09DRAFT_1292948 [Coniochaeta sp. 2T2.1]
MDVNARDSATIMVTPSRVFLGYDPVHSRDLNEWVRPGLTVEQMERLNNDDEDREVLWEAATLAYIERRDSRVTWPSHQAVWLATPRVSMEKVDADCGRHIDVVEHIHLYGGCWSGGAGYASSVSGVGFPPNHSPSFLSPTFRRRSGTRETARRPASRVPAPGPTRTSVPAALASTTRPGDAATAAVAVQAATRLASGARRTMALEAARHKWLGTKAAIK